ncbi:MAG: hypothetical protein R3264_09370 [Anaerolineae bacterium]|nr:hypothetical protein [Anaerolineae bacterium]
MIDKTVQVLPREIEAATRWAFRAAKIPAGYSVAATALVRQAEIDQGLGLSVLHHYLSNPDRQPPVPTCLISDEPHQIGIDARSQHLLICGPNIVDLACARAINRGEVRVTVQNVDGGQALLPHLADTAAKRDLLCLIVASNETVIAVPQAPLPLRVSVTQPQTESGGTQLADLLEQWGILTGQESDRLRPALTLENSEPTSRSSRIVIYCRRLNQDDMLRISTDKWLPTLAPAKGLAIVQPHARLKQQRLAHQKGVAVRAATWQAIKKFGSRILVPVSAKPTQKNVPSKRKPTISPASFKS